MEIPGEESKAKVPSVEGVGVGGYGYFLEIHISIWVHVLPNLSPFRPHKILKAKKINKKTVCLWHA